MGTLGRLRPLIRRAFDRPPSERIYLIGAAGHPNFGDDFIARAWIKYLARRKPSAELWLDCPEPGRAAFLFRDMHPSLRTTNTLWQMAYQSDGPDARAIAVDAARYATELGSPQVDIGLLALQSMDHFHFVGGGYMNDIWPHNIGLLAAVVAVKRRTGARVTMTGQGFLPLSDDNRDALKDLLSEADLVESRDSAGASALDVAFGLDDALLGLPHGASSEAGLPDIMILLQGDFMADEHRPWSIEAARAFINSALARGKAGVGFVEGIPAGDRGVFEALRNEYPEARYFTFRDLWERGLPARPGQDWFTSRFHFHLLAAAAGATGTFVSLHDSYYGIKHASLLALGTGWNEIAVGDELTPGSLAGTADPNFVRRAATLHSQKTAQAHEIYSRRRERRVR